MFTHVEENMVYTIEPGKNLMVAFTGFNDKLDSMDFEFGNALRNVDASKIFVRNRQKVWYHSGISEQFATIGGLIPLLSGLISQATPENITFVGTSAGGYAAILFGHFLKADFVHAIGPQTFLDKERNKYHGIFGHSPGEGEGSEFWYSELHKLYALNLPQEDCFYDLKQYLTSWNKVTRYNIHISAFPEENEGARADHIYAEHLATCGGVYIRRHPCSGHSCAASYLKSNNALTSTLIDCGLEK